MKKKTILTTLTLLAALSIDPLMAMDEDLGAALTSRSNNPVMTQHTLINVDLERESAAPKVIQKNSYQDIWCNAKRRVECYWVTGILLTGSIAGYLIHYIATAPSY